MNVGKVVNSTDVNKYGRSVCIIGVGCTPFMNTIDQEETNGLTEGELFGYAALKAMEDAGVEPKDVQYYFHGEASPLNNSKYLTPNMQVANWFGMKGKGSIHHSEACCTGYLAMEAAVNAVAGGKYDCVLTGCVEFGDSIILDQYQPQYKREKFPMNIFMDSVNWLIDNAYTREMMCGKGVGFDDPAVTYVHQYGLTEEQVDDAMIGMALANRKNACLNEKAVIQTSFEEEARKAGFDDVWDYMRSAHNPKIGNILRASGMETKCDGAAAVIVASTDWAKKHHLAHTPIEILGIGSASCELLTPHVEIKGGEEATRQAFEMSGITSEEIDLVFANDFIISSQLLAAEMSGYMPRGEGWKYFVEGRTAYDGDKPINPNGGRTSFGHAHAASGLADIYEAVLQMRGLAGARQVKKLPKVTYLKGFGGGQNSCAIILKTLEELRKEDQPVNDQESPVQLKKVVKEYYDALAKGKILGRKCKRCGAVEWPPVYACNTCGHNDMEWVEMSGVAEVNHIIVPGAMTRNPDCVRFSPYVFGVVNMDGAEANAVITGIKPKKAKELWNQMPFQVKAKIVTNGEGESAYPTLIFEYIES